MTARDLEILCACPEGLSWARTQPDDRTAWHACPRADWLLWVMLRTGMRLTYAQRSDIAHGLAYSLGADLGRFRFSTVIAAAHAWISELCPESPNNPDHLGWHNVWKHQADLVRSLVPCPFSPHPASDHSSGRWNQ